MKATNELRWIYKKITLRYEHKVVIDFEKVLQQKWIDEQNNEKWIDIPEFDKIEDYDNMSLDG